MFYKNDEIEPMKRIISRGLAITGFGNGGSTFVFFAKRSDAAQLAGILNQWGKELGQVRQFFFDEKTAHQVGPNYGIILEKEDRERPVPPGQFSLFCVMTRISRKDAKIQLAEHKREGQLVDLQDDQRLVSSHLKALVGLLAR